MVWKKGKKPEQYLFTITEEFTNDWNTFKNKASENNQNISNLLRNTVSSKIYNDKKKKALVLSPHTDDAELGCGGTIAKLIEEGWAVHVIYFSAVRTRFPQLVNEAENSARILGMTYEILDFNTRYFPRDRQDILQILHDHSRKAVSYTHLTLPTIYSV